MSLRPLKHYLPKSLYGRAALILVLPVVTLQLVVSFFFIRLHLDDITTQMTQTVVRELRMISDMTNDAPDRDTALAHARLIGQPLNIEIGFPEPGAVPHRDYYRWYDFSGRVMVETLHQSIPETVAVLTPDNLRVTLFVETKFGVAEVVFGRRRATAAAPHQLIVAMLSFGLLMTLIAFAYMRNQLRPILRLARAAQAFGRGQSVPYTPTGAVEVRIAGGAFLDMRARIERHIEQRTLMLSGVSHDLRTPLTRLKLGLSMLDDAEAAPLLRDVDEMQRLIDVFLDFTRGAGEGEMVPTDPVALVQGVVEDAQRSGKAVALTTISGQGLVNLRPAAIRRAIDNLIGNAVRYGTRAEVSVALTDKSLRIRVEDDGPGIPPDQRGEALKPFARLDAARNQNRGSGVGLGLAIVHDIARAHGGTLRLDQSEALGGLRADIVIGR